MAEHELNKIVDDDGEVFNLRDSTKQPVADRVTSIRASSSASDDKYPSEKAVASAIEALDVSSVGGAGKYISAISEADGKISATATTMDTTPTANSTNAVTSGGIKTAIDNASTADRLYANQKWGGAFRTSNSPLDVALIFSRNILLGINPDCVKVEYSTDGGATWLDYGLTDSQKTKLFAQFDFGIGVYCGKNTHIQPGYTGTIVGTKDLSDSNIADQRLRITFASRPFANVGTTSRTGEFIIAHSVRRIAVYMSTQSANRGTHCKLSTRSMAQFVAGNDTWTDYGDFPIAGDSGWSSIPCNNGTSESGFQFGAYDSSAYSMNEIRLEIWSTKLNANPVSSQTGNLRIQQICAISDKVNTTTSKWSAMMRFGIPCTGIDLDNNWPIFNNGIKFTARKLKTNLARTADSTFDGSADQTNIPVTGTLPVGNGGTGKTTAKAAEYNLTTGKSEISDATSGDDRVVFELASPSESNGVTRGFRKLSTIWTWIKGLLSSESGVNISGSSTSCTGNAATATTAQNYNTSTGTIKTALDGKRDIYGDFYGEGTSIYGWKIGQMALGTGGSANGYMTAIVRIDRWTKLDNGDRDFDSFFGVVKLWARNSSDGTTTSTKASIHSFKPTAFTSTSRGYAIFKKSSNNGHTIDWYIGLAPDSDSTYTPKKEIAYSLIEISPMYEVNFTRGLERVSSDPGFDSWMDNCTREPWLAHDQYGAGSSSLPVYVDADNKVVGVDPKLTQGNLIRSLDVWTSINDTDEYVPVANNSATAQFPHGRYSFARIWAWIKGKLTSVDGVDISGNAATASDAKSGSTLATTLSGKAPANHASSSDTYGKGTESNYGHVMLDNSALSASSTNTDGVACGKGHTHIQYLTSHQSISGKMNTSADNAASGALQNLTAQLNEGTDDFTDGTEIFSSYAGNSGFATTGYVNKPYRRKASSMWNYINSKLVLERSPASVGTGHKRIQLGYGSYGNGVVGYCCYLVHIFFNFVGGTLAGKGVTVLVSYDWRTTTYQSPKCQVLNDNFFSDTGYRIVLANFLSDNNTKLHICLGLVNTSAPTTLVGFAYSYCKIMRVGYGLNWTESIASDDVGTYNYLVKSTYFMETDTNNKIKVVTALPSSPDPNTIYFV